MHLDPLRRNIAVGNRSCSAHALCFVSPMEILRCDFAIANHNVYMPPFLFTDELLRSNPPMRYRYRIVALSQAPIFSQISAFPRFYAYHRITANLMFYRKSPFYCKSHVLPQITALPLYRPFTTLSLIAIAYM